jgi:2-keto-4-pentenoate hydratase/2-oxohepta-3-ene-1,7-dioic acid hydratase in catechol pathway
MKYATIRHAGGSLAGGSLAGMVDGDSFRPFIPAFEDLAAAIPMLRSGTPELGAPLKLSEISLCAPILRPPHNIICVGKNYRAHAEEFSKSGFDAGSSAQDAIPQYPIVFTKPSSSISGPTDDIPLFPGLDDAVDYEAELAVVIGKGGRAISRENAMNHVFGYTLVNDVTARDLQQRHKQWFLGKAIDGFCPMGPVIVSADALDYRELRISCSVNGEQRQNASLRDLIFDIPVLIETISKTMTLAPGDVIATGTPEGVGIGFSPPKFLKEGDVVICEIPGIGRLRNTVRKSG